MNRRLILVSLAACFGAAALAQTPMVQEGSSRSPKRPAAERLSQVMSRVADELGLDADQRAKLDELVARHEQQLADTNKKVAEMREAERAGDEARAKQLRAELDASREGGRNAGIVAAILHDLEPSLRPDQKSRLDEVRSRFDRRGASREPAEIAALNQAADEMDLDAGKRKKFDELVAEYAKKIAPSTERMAEIADNFRQLSEARKAGDEAKVKEFEAKGAGARGDREKQLEKLLSDVERLLNKDQKEILDAHRDAILAAASGGRAGTVTDVRGVIRAAQRLDLDDSQKSRLEQIERDAKDALRDLKAGDRAGRIQLANKTRNDIAKILNPDQVRAFENELNKSSPARGKRGADGERGGRRRGSGAKDAGKPAEDQPEGEENP